VASPVASGTVKVGIRPEDVRIVIQSRSASEGPAGSVSATVVSRLFYGDSTTLLVRTAAGSELTIDQRPASDAAPGETVRIEWLPAAMHVFPADEETAQGKEAAK
jgi:ABC-type Fe3+/spermidine/putrescine transport system ATPase subunit